MYQLIVYIPELQCDKVIQAMFEKGAGHYGNYENCCWKVLGQGQFKPLVGSKPFMGQHDNVTFVNEYRVEMLCKAPYLKQTIKAMKKAHPYEEPAYTVLQHVAVE